MSETLISYSAKFPHKKDQLHWFQSLVDEVPVRDIAKLCGCSERTIRDWKRAKFTPRHDCIEKICSSYSIPLPHVHKFSRYEHTIQAGKKGGRATIKKYGGVPVDESVRSEHWHKWWSTKGKYQANLPTSPKGILKPKKSTGLAEFMGIMMGDGTVGTYHLSITLNATDDAEYAQFVIHLISKLFGVIPHVYKRKGKNAIAITVARKLLVAYVHDLGLPVGHKIRQGIDIPQWIHKNSQYSSACVRGLMDTDGSVFTHTYTSKGKKYSYKKLSFSSASPSLRTSVHNILTTHKIASHVCATNVHIDNQSSVTRYFTKIGSHNPKHLKRMCD